MRRAWALVRNTWRGLTSMRTALVLLFLLALAAIPGAVLPQRELNEQKTREYIAEQGFAGRLMDRLELFEVFGSFWFTAIYVLLFVSLVGCIVPRCADYARALRAVPVAAPRNLSRLPHHYQGETAKSPQEVAAQVRSGLRGWRLITRTDGDQVTVSAEKGYTRELGNLVFHLALVGLLAAIAVGKLFGYEGSVIVIADGGPGFCSTSPAAFDSFRGGRVSDGTGLTPICVRVKDFKADYLNNGQAEMFRSNIAYQVGADLAADTWRETELRVNHPLRAGGDRVYLQGHGYAPRFTVTFPNGEQRSEAVQWRPEEASTFLSSGAMRIDPPAGLYPDADERRKHQLAIEGLFAPTAVFSGTLLSSGFPALRDPAVAIDIYSGDAGLDTGKPQSLFSLSRDLIDQKRLVKQARVNLRPGESTVLPDKTIVRFDGAYEFVNLQVSHDPAQLWVLVSAVTMMVGLLLSLVIRRRRIWLRCYPSEDKRQTVVELGGLARTDHAGWGPEFGRLRDRLLESTEKDKDRP